VFLLFSPLSISLDASTFSRDGPGRRAKGGACNEPPPRGLRTRKLGKMYAAMIYIGRMRVRLNKKKTTTVIMPFAALFFCARDHDPSPLLRQHLPISPTPSNDPS